jgi:hypothetical protein
LLSSSFLLINIVDFKVIRLYMNIKIFSFFLSVLVFELTAPCLLGRHSTT